MSVSRGEDIPAEFRVPTEYNGVSVDNAWLGAHPSVRHFRPLFEFGHLTGSLRDTSAAVTTHVIDRAQRG